MRTRSHVIKVKDKDGTITVDPHEHAMVVEEAVRWQLTNDSDPNPSLEIVMGEGGVFSARHFALDGHGISLVAHEPGMQSYTVSADDGRRKIDPVIIVDPIAPPPPPSGDA